MVGARQTMVALPYLALALALGACQAPAAMQGVAKPAASPALEEGERGSASNSPTALLAAALIGLPRERVEQVFGLPRQVRREAPAEVWQYAGKDCVVDLYLYQAAGGGMAVSFIEARDSAAVATEPESCFSTLTQRASL